MTGLISVVVATTVATFGSGWFVRPAMLRLGVLDVPNHRSSHVVATVRGGGVACVIGVAVGASVIVWENGSLPLGCLLAAAALALVGFTDDVRGLPALPRLLAQATIGLALGVTVGGIWLGLAGALLFPLVVNVVNFMDGINGISGAVMATWSATALLAGASIGSPGLSALGCLGLGSALGFLPWNVPVARFFLGDVGSYFFGGLVAGGILLGTSSGSSFLLLMAPLGIYLGDVMWTLLTRARKREPLLEAHRDHAYQRLVSVTGLGHAGVATLVACASALIAAAWYVLAPAAAAVLTLVVVTGFLSLPQTVEERAS